MCHVGVQIQHYKQRQESIDWFNQFNRPATYTHQKGKQHERRSVKSAQGGV